MADDSLRCSTVEGAILPVDVTVAYHVQAADVLTAFQNFGSDDITIVQKAYMRWVTTYGLNAVSGQRLHSVRPNLVPAEDYNRISSVHRNEVRS